MSNDWNSVLIPMIRKVMPEIIAQDIAGVMPMVDPGIVRLISCEEPLSSRPYCVRVSGGWGSVKDKSSEMRIWCAETFGDMIDPTVNLIDSPLNPRWFFNENTFKFRDDKDRTMFLLKWS